MKKVRKTFLTVIVGCVLYLAGSEDVRGVLDANIQQSAVKVSEQKKILDEGKRKQLKLLDEEASQYAREGHYVKAICVYDEMLRMAPESSGQIENEIQSCLKKLRSSLQKYRQREEKDESLQLMKSAEQILQEREEVAKEEKERKELIESAQVAQQEAMSKLAKATHLLSGQNAKSAGETNPPIIPRNTDYNQLIREGFEKSQAYLDSGDYGSARDEFSRILDRVDAINKGNFELETARQIKQASQKGTTQVISDIRSNNYDAARNRLLELIEKTSLLAGQKEEQEMRDRTSRLVEGYLKNASELLDKAEYESAKLELEKVFELDPQNKKASALLDLLGDVISIVNESP